jgi:exopolysaccharide biosynthesis polyprenyl glycosylphosphotransferase
MYPMRRLVLVGALRALDLLTMMASFLAAAAAVARPLEAVTFEEFLSMRVKLQNVLLLAAMGVLWHYTLKLFGIYDSKRLVPRRREVADLLGASAVAALAIQLCGWAFSLSVVSGVFVPVFFLCSAGALIASRLLLRAGLHELRTRGVNLRHVLVVGTNRRAIAFARELQAKPELGYVVGSFVDEFGWRGADDLRDAGFPPAVDLSRFVELLRRGPVDEVMVFLPFRSCYHLIRQVVEQCEEQGVPVTFPSPAFDTKNARSVAALAPTGPVVTLLTGAMVGWPVVVKRVFDVVVSATLLVVLAPVFAAVAMAVKLSSPGPVIFAQERLGLNKRRFRMLKFRTMVTNAEQRLAELEHLNEVSGPVFKIRKDPRITPVGAFLRRTSLDELPQLVNVLMGDISLVGPRPLPLRDYEGFEQDWHRRRFSVPPGITCLWQVSGRSDVSFDQWMQLDVQYIDNWSLWLDLKILLKTIPAVVKGSGAA